MAEADPNDLKLLPGLADLFKKLNKYKKALFRPSLQTDLWNALESGKDVIDLRETIDNFSEIHKVYSLWAIQTVLTRRKEVLKNSEKLAKAMLKEQEKIVDEETTKRAKLLVNNDPLVFKDQGFTRATVLILLPMRNTAFEVIECLLALSNRNQVENKKRFMDDFAPTPEECQIDPLKSDDYNILFRGKIDDCFRIGLQFTNKSIKLYSSFYESDILVASPLGLRTIIGTAGDAKRDFDFLSSISLVIVDQCDIISMQNWDHLTLIFEHLNLIPKESHGCDFSRIKDVYLDGKGASIRQSCLFSRYIFPELNALSSQACSNSLGVAKLSAPRASLGPVVAFKNSIELVRVEVNSHIDAADKRFKVFTSQFLTQRSGSTCIFVSSYFDFVRLKKFFKDSDLSYACLSEYSTGPEISAARASFFNGHRQYLIVTERYYFFKRHQIRGVKELIFYSLPVESQFFAEWICMVEDNTSKVSCLFDKMDSFKLAEIFGLKNTARFIKSSKSRYFLPSQTNII